LGALSHGNPTAGDKIKKALIAIDAVHVFLKEMFMVLLGVRS
jgi:hypothetical protein